MRITYDKGSDAFAIDFRDSEYQESEEIYDGFVVDFDKSGRPMVSRSTTTPQSSWTSIAS